MRIQNKIINHIMLKGQKVTSEKLLLKILKELQKNSTKSSNKIFQLAIIYAIPIFRLHKIKNKKNVKEIPGFIKSKDFRSSMAIKSLVNSAKNKNLALYKKLESELLLSIQNKSNTVTLKNELQKSVLNQKRLFLYYRWN